MDSTKSTNNSMFKKTCIETLNSNHFAVKSANLLKIKIQNVNSMYINYSMCKLKVQAYF